MPFICKWPSLG